MGLSMKDLELLDMGMILDMMTERGNDDVEYDTLATQADMDKF